MVTNEHLQKAIEQGCLQAVAAALDKGADIEAADIHGYPGFPLRLACFAGHIDIVAELLRRGANARAANSQGADAPLRMALRGKHEDIASLLIEHGAGSPPEPAPQSDKEAADRRKQRDRRIADYGPPSSTLFARHCHILGGVANKNRDLWF